MKLDGISQKKLYTRWYVGSKEDGNSRKAMDEVKIAKKLGSTKIESWKR
jgi:hypothetical protein